MVAKHFDPNAANDQHVDGIWLSVSDAVDVPAANLYASTTGSTTNAATDTTTIPAVPFPYAVSGGGLKHAKNKV